MAHIPDGVLSAPVLVTGALVSVGLLTVALRRLDYERLPPAAVLSAAFFVSSLISVPMGPSSVHLLLNGLMGLLLGWTAIPAILVALILQAAFFGFGGLLVLGVNTMNLALPALFCALVLAPWLQRCPPARIPWIGFAAGALGVLFTGLLVALSLGLSGEAFVPAAKVMVLIYPPLALVEGLITATTIGFLWRVAPEMLTREDNPRV
ncbi:cobalt transporter CbiM [Thiocystis violacea]|uniref:cobalt transporter CbiM n=1 Tax=Thiocystis violacea TaxID=13725 RepID=UPI001905239C|nr:cobalt transporter CbiM [Thiocystis violacea]MBK1718269.1 cobalamin biosynthesis protein CbiM [Thiocystis violacea]